MIILYQIKEEPPTAPTPAACRRKKIADISLINNVYTKKIMYFCILIA